MEWTPQTILIFILGLMGLVRFGVDVTVKLLGKFNKRDISDKTQDTSIALLSNDIKSLEGSYKTLSNSFSLFQQNEFKHLEGIAQNNRETLIQMRTMLDERLPNKK